MLTIKIDSREPYFKTNKFGEYYRILLPGSYSLSVMYDCTCVYQTTINIPSDKQILELNITLPFTKSKFSGSYTLNKYPVFCGKQLVNCVDPSKGTLSFIVNNANICWFDKSYLFYLYYLLIILFTDYFMLF